MLQDSITRRSVTWTSIEPCLKCTYHEESNINVNCTSTYLHSPLLRSRVADPDLQLQPRDEAFANRAANIRQVNMGKGDWELHLLSGNQLKIFIGNKINGDTDISKHFKEFIILLKNCV